MEDPGAVVLVAGIAGVVAAVEVAAVEVAREHIAQDAHILGVEVAHIQQEARDYILAGRADTVAGVDILGELGPEPADHPASHEPIAPEEAASLFSPDTQSGTGCCSAASGFHQD